MATDIRTSELKEPTDLANYLFTRLKQMGIDSIHGVPGDFNLVALDYLNPCGLNWVGNCNELNAGYAADGYARIKGMSAVVTTFGVGELSLLNAIAGAYAEFVPVVHVVGTPSTSSQKDGMILHHTLGNGNFNVFSEMSAHISVDVAKLNDPRDAPSQIDHALRECYLQSRPVYITLPTDMVQKKVEGARLKTPVDLTPPKNDPEIEEYVLDEICRELSEAKSPALLIDSCTIRHRVVPEARALIEKSGLPTFVAPMGKGAVDETLPNYGGVYAGDASNPGVRERVEGADLLITIGSIKSDFNTAGFSYRTSQLRTIDFHSDMTRVRYSEYPKIGMKGLLKRLVNNLPKLSVQAGPKPPQNLIADSDNEGSDPTITHSWFWSRMGQWLQADDIILNETGTSNYGIIDTRFPKGVTNISQILWGSIGYSVGSCQGAALAAKENGNQRTILFVGDGSFQLTAQELSTMIRHKLRPIIFVICNEGYTIERYIHGMEAGYNDIQAWNHQALVPAFGAKEGEYKTYRIETKDQVHQLFQDKDFSAAKHIQLVELFMPKKDAPAALKAVAEASAKLNSKQ